MYSKCGGIVCGGRHPPSPYLPLDKRLRNGHGLNLVGLTKGRQPLWLKDAYCTLHIAQSDSARLFATCQHLAENNLSSYMTSCDDEGTTVTLQ